jgi:hypothetical protein
MHLEIVPGQDLAGEPGRRGDVVFKCEPLPFAFGHRAGVAFENIDATGRAARLAATAMQDIDTGVLQGKDQAGARLSLERCDSFGFDAHHLLASSLYVRAIMGRPRRLIQGIRNWQKWKPLETGYPDGPPLN